MIGAPTLAISPQKVCSFIAKARQFGAADAISEHRLNGDGDAPIDTPESHADCPTFSELASFIDELTENEQVDLVVLTWLGRGDGTISELNELREEADYFHNKRAARYLLAKPMLVDHLKEGLARLGCNYEAIDAVTHDKQASGTYEFDISAKARS